MSPNKGKPKVFAAGLRCQGPADNHVAKIGKLAAAVGLANADFDKKLVAVKVHVGELGNGAFLRPTLVRPIVELIRSRGGEPFLAETTTLYTGTRSSAPAHIMTAHRHGFGPEVTGAPMVICDGLSGRDAHKVAIKGQHFQEVSVASGVFEADALVVISHFKGHEVTGFGGAIKNLAMGCCSRTAKLAMHASLRPSVLEQRCVHCGNCLAWCSVKAIRQDRADGPAIIDSAKCQGCGECLVACRVGAIRINWDSDVRTVSERMAEHALGVVVNKPGRCYYLNVVTDVVPCCDCYGFNDAPIVPDLGFAASTDPVALDNFCMDWVNSTAALPNTALPADAAPGANKFACLHEGIDPLVQIVHAENIGLGRRDYERVGI